MRARYKDPNGTGVVEIDDNATVGTLFEALKAKTSSDHFTVKYGPPASMHTIDMDQMGVIAKSLGLHGETLTIVPSEIPIPLRCNESSTDDCIIPWPERVGNLVLRVVPSDNSCLFTAFGGAIPGHFQSAKLRQMMADYIAEHPELYSEAVLGCAPVEYQHAIRNPDRWGGGIELSILSTIFDIEICTFDVQGQHLINFGEEKKNRCILIYSGIHYDRVAFSPSDHSHGSVPLLPDMDITIWPTTDSEILEKTRLLVRKLNAGRYYTDTQGLVLKCDQAGCGWIGNGQLAAKQHADLTGHVGLTEIPDLDEDDVLRMCSIPGCNFICQGRRAIVQHEDDTGHCKFDIIPDI